MASPGNRWRVAEGSSARLASVDPASRAGAPGDESTTELASEGLRRELIDLQEVLWADKRQSLLVVLQAVDAGGKDGTIKRVFSGVNPLGVRVTSFREPSEEELSHDFLWRVHRGTPARGEIAIFNRSHYEGVLVERVFQLVPELAWRGRYRIIGDFEHGLVEAGTTIVKLFLQISKEEQAERFRKRLTDPTRHWKFNTADLEKRSRFEEYQIAFEEALSKTSTEAAPWYVIPADRKWYRNWAVLTILVETLRSMDLKYPELSGDLRNAVIT
ncbi:MAG: PPK2 family polyphosphate kinase [Acidimicrobiia bacterium]